jgi:DNA-binding transcriptional regulator GbsR (MarR family)
MFFSNVSANSLRKFFQTRMEGAGVNPNWMDHMIGHKLPGVGNHYSLPTDEELFDTYRKAYDALRVVEIKDDVGRIKALEEELQKEREDADREKEMADMKTQLAALTLLTESLRNSLETQIKARLKGNLG